MPDKKRRERLFLLLCLAAAGVCAGLVFRFTVPLRVVIKRYRGLSSISRKWSIAWTFSPFST